MAGWLSNLVNNLAEVIDIIECKYEHDDKKLETCGIRHIATALLNTQTFILEYKCLCCNKKYQKTFDEKSKRQFFNSYKYCNHMDNNHI